MIGIYDTVRDRLLANATLSEIIGENNVWEERLPATAEVPSLAIRTPGGIKPNSESPMEDETLYVDGWFKYLTKAKNAESQIIISLDGVRASLSDSNLFRLDRESVNRLWEEKSKLWHLIITYNCIFFRK